MSAIPSFDTGSTTRASYDTNAIKNPSLDGVDDRVDCGNQAGLWSQSLTKFSFSIWAYPTQINTAATDKILVNHGWNVAQSFILYQEGDANGWSFRISGAASRSLSGAGLPYQRAQWVHLVCTYDNSLGSANIKLYVNGTLGSTAGDSVAAINVSAILGLGQGTGPSTHTPGRVKDFRWWTTKALTQTEVTNVYNDSPSAPTPDYWLKMNEGVGNPLDAIGGVLTGTLANGAEWKVDTALSRPQYSSPNQQTYPGSAPNF